MSSELREVTYKVVVEQEPESGRIVSEHWYNARDELHRDGDLPAVVEYSKNSEGVPIAMDWFQNGKRHRSGDKPASIVYDLDDPERVIFEAYAVLDEYHRDGSRPAVRIINDEERSEERRYCVYGELSRTDGPAIEVVDIERGEVLRCSYHLNGQLLDGPPTVTPSTGSHSPDLD